MASRKSAALKELPFGLGRREKPDERDEKFLLKSLLPKASVLKEAQKEGRKFWYANGWWGDQGQTSQCVAYAWNHFFKDGPVTQPKMIPNTDGYYTLCQKNDEWAGENYDGTSVRAGAKIAQMMGLVDGYYWAWDVKTLANSVLTLGPVVVGTTWYEGMFFPTNKGFLELKGRMAGGHAYLINGVDTNKGFFRIKNSWGREWGLKGHAKIYFDEMDQLIQEDGEVCLATEVKLAA